MTGRLSCQWVPDRKREARLINDLCRGRQLLICHAARKLGIQQASSAGFCHSRGRSRERVICEGTTGRRRKPSSITSRQARPAAVKGPGAAHQPAGRLALRYCLLSGYWGSLPLEGGVEAAYRAEIDAAPDPVAKLSEIEQRLNKLWSPFRTAETFWVEEIIDPRETRPLLCEFAQLSDKIVAPGPSAFPMRP
jgi:hypothetical protein